MSSRSPEPLAIGWAHRLWGAWTVVVLLVATHGLTAVLYADRARTSLGAALLLDRSTRMRVSAGGQFAPLVDDGQLWRLARSVFLHADALHLTLNAVAILVLGRLLEPWVGAVRFVWWFALAGVGASAGSHLAGMLQSDGASGGAFGLMGAVLVLAWRRRERLDPEEGGVYTRWLPGFLGVNVVLSLVLPFVDAVGHFGGLAIGVALGALARPRPPGRAVTALEGLGILGILAVALLGPWGSALR